MEFFGIAAGDPDDPDYPAPVMASGCLTLTLAQKLNSGPRELQTGWRPCQKGARFFVACSSPALHAHFRLRPLQPACAEAGPLQHRLPVDDTTSQVGSSRLDSK